MIITCCCGLIPMQRDLQSITLLCDVDYSGGKEVGSLCMKVREGVGKRCVIFIRYAEKQLSAILHPYTGEGRKSRKRDA